MQTASDKEIAEAIAPFFPGLTDRRQHRGRRAAIANVGAPIWSDRAPSSIQAGLAKAQEIMVVGGMLPADKEIAYDKIVTNIYAEKAQQQFASK